MRQKMYDPLIYGSDLEAKKARQKDYVLFKLRGIKTYRWVLRNQLKKYECLGVYDGRIRNVYMLDIYEENK